MHSFENKHGKTYEIHIDALRVESAQEKLGLDLFSLEDISKGTLGIGDFVRLIHILTGTDEPVEEFSKGLNGDVLQAAGEAYQNELLEFLPSAQRNLIQDAMDCINEEAGKMQDFLKGRLSEILSSAS